MPLSYDGTGRTVSLEEAMGDPGTPLAGTRTDRGDANYRNAWIKDNNPSWYAGDGLINMAIMNAQVPLAERDPKFSNSVCETSGDGLVSVRKLPL